VNTLGENNSLATTLDADLNLRTSGIETLSDAGDAGTTTGNFMKRALFGGDLGLGIDLGFTYHLTERTTITGSVLDVGFLYHTDAKNYSLLGNATVEGIQIDVLQQFSNLNRDFWQDLVDEIETAIPFNTDDKGYFSLRPTKLYGSIRHDFGKPVGGSSGAAFTCDCTGSTNGSNTLRSKYRNSAGAQLFVMNRPRGPQAAITGFYTRRFGNILAVKATYTADKFSFTNLGVGVNLQAGPINFYVMGDNLLSYQNIAASNYASFKFGLNIISWGK